MAHLFPPVNAGADRAALPNGSSRRARFSLGHRAAEEAESDDIASSADQMSPGVSAGQNTGGTACTVKNGVSWLSSLDVDLRTTCRETDAQDLPECTAGPTTLDDAGR